MSKEVTIPSDERTFKAIKVLILKEHWHFDQTNMKFPIIECPYCGNGILGDPAPHGIKENGDVFNSVVCQNEKCNFHRYVTLEGWTFGYIERGKKIKPK